MSDDTERRIETAKALTQLRAEVKHNSESTEKLLKALYDNGLVTQVTVNRDSLSRLWKWVYTLSMVILGLAGWVLRGSLT